MNSIIFLQLLLACVTIERVHSECYDPDAIAPCTGCQYNYIECGAKRGAIDFKSIFHTLNTTSTERQKHYKYFHLKSFANEYPASFEDITFDEIKISNQYLEKIDTRTSMTTHHVTKRLTIGGTRLETKNILEFLNAFSEVEYIDEQYNGKFYYLPEQAFTSAHGYRPHLKQIRLYTPRDIHGYAFRQLSGLKLIEFYGRSVDTIRANAFSFNEPSKETLVIQLANNRLTGQSFEPKALDNIRRPTLLNLTKSDRDQNVTFLYEDPFLTFFKSDPKNRVDLSGNPFDCGDCRTYWLKKNKLQERLINATCSDGKPFDDPGHFAGCEEYTHIPCQMMAGEYVHCIGTDGVEVSRNFKSLSMKLNAKAKHFKKFLLSSTKNTTLPDNVFQDITFAEIAIYGTNVLTIDSTTVMSTHDVTEKITINNNPYLTQESLLNFMRNFTRVKSFVEFSNPMFKELPDNAFASERRMDYVELHISSPDSIGSNAFRQMAELALLEFRHSRVNYIAANAFKLPVRDSYYKDYLTIDLSKNNLTGASFAPASLSKIGRPTVLKLTGGNFQKVKFLAEDAFLPFFTSDAKNTVDLGGNPFDCGDCRSFWVKEKALQSRLLNVQCSDGKPFDDATHFSDCHKQSIYPCTSSPGKYVNCIGSDALDLAQVFKTLSSLSTTAQDKHYNTFLLNNTNVTSIPDNVFQDITFDVITISETKLVSIDSRTQMATHGVTKRLLIEENRLLTAESILGFMKSFFAVEYVSEKRNRLLAQLPSDALTSSRDHQKRLTQLYLLSPKSIGSYAFRQLSALVDLRMPSVVNFSANAFSFDEPSNNALVIDFGDYYSGVKGDSFALGSLVDIHRPVTLKNVGQGMKYLIEGVFLPFFQSNAQNAIDMSNIAFDCQDCRSYWIDKKQMLSRLLRVKCSDGQDYDYPTHFKDC